MLPVSMLVHLIATWIRWPVSTLIAQALAQCCHPGLFIGAQHAHAGMLVHIIAMWMRWRVSTLIAQALAQCCHPGLFMCAPARSRGLS